MAGQPDQRQPQIAPISMATRFLPGLPDAHREHISQIVSTLPGLVISASDATGNPLNVGHASTAFAVDWDANGTLDLVLGNIRGEVHLARSSYERPAESQLQ